METSFKDFISIVFLLFSMANWASGQAGTLDPSFGGGGFVTLNINTNNAAQDLAIQEDQKIVVVGSTEFDGMLLARFLPNGNLDDEFSLDGYTTLQIGAVNNGAKCVAVQPDGKIIVAGYADNQVVVLRTNTFGSLDNSFGENGVTTLDLPSSNNFPNDLLIQPDGKIVVAGETNEFFFMDAFVARLLPDGSMDPSFGNEGITIVDFRGELDRANGVALQEDGKIVFTGQVFENETSYVGLGRLDTDGMIDSTFGVNGLVQANTNNVHDAGYDLYIKPDQRIVVVAEGIQGGTQSTIIHRFLQDGSIDPTFGFGGRWTYLLGDGSNRPFSVTRQFDGQFILVGDASNNSNTMLTLMRCLPEGDLSTDFGNNGMVTQTFGWQINSANASALQADGKLIVAGLLGGTNSTKALIARYYTGLNVAVPDLDLPDPILLFPNPVHDILQLSPLYSPEIILFNTLGEAVFSGKGNSFDLSELPSGLYRCQIMLEEQVFIQTIMKASF